MPISDDARRISREYEEFAYIVSHDLSAPIRHIKQFTGLLLDARQDQVSAEEEDYARFLYNALDQIDSMQEALLEFSRLNTRPEAIKDTDCSAAVQQALTALSDDINRIDTTITYEGLPVLQAQPGKINRLFYLLLDNALKFHKKDEMSRVITITAAERGEHWHFDIQDNGIGIPEAHYDDVLRMFRRLHPNSYDGVGAGLSLAQKIVHNHGGQLSLRAGAGAGTCVMFSLAK